MNSPSHLHLDGHMGYSFTVNKRWLVKVLSVSAK